MLVGSDCQICHGDCDDDDGARKTASFFEFSLCLSRACLGKMIVFIHKWLNNAVFSQSALMASSATSEAGCTIHRRAATTSCHRQTWTKIQCVPMLSVTLDPFYIREFRGTLDLIVRTYDAMNDTHRYAFILLCPKPASLLCVYNELNRDPAPIEFTAGFEM